MARTMRSSQQAISWLAGLYRAQGRYAEAEPLFKRALAVSEKALGPDHPGAVRGGGGGWTGKVKERLFAHG